MLAIRKKVLLISLIAAAAAIAAQERNNARLMAIDGVVGTAVGHGPQARGAVFVFTAERGVAGIPDKVDGVPVIAHVTGEIFALKPPCHPCGGGGEGGGDDGPVDPTARFARPVPIGVSTGHATITAGTIGARVTDGTDVIAQSNNHVYAASNGAAIGDNVLQPGTFDGGTDPADAIGTLEAFVHINFDGSDNVVDAAIAVSSTAELGNATPSDGYGTPKSETVAAAINQKVKKYGRTTGLTKGQVFAINATVNVNYGAPGVARFVNQIIIFPGEFSAGGDSGSLIVADGKGR